MRVLPLFLRRLVFDDVLIEQPVVNLVREASGRLNVETLGKPAGTVATSPPEAPTPGGTSARPAFQLGSLRLRHGTIRYVERATDRTMTLEDVAVDAREPRFGAPVPIAFRARLAGKDVRFDALSSEGVLDLASDPPGYEGTFTAGPGGVGPIAIARVAAKIRAKAPDVTLESATAELLGGTVAGDATFASAGANAGFHARVAGKALQLAQLPARQDRPHPAGALFFDGSFAGPPPGAPDMKTALTGTGSFRVADGRIAGAGFGKAILGALGPLIGAGMTDRLTTRYPDLFGSDDLRFTQLSGSGRLAGGRIASDDLVLASASYDAHGAGTLGLDGDVDMALRVSASPALTEDAVGRSKLRPVLVGGDGRLTIPLRVRGPLQHPHVTPDPEFAASVARGVLGGTGLEEAAGSLLERFLGGKKKR